MESSPKNVIRVGSRKSELALIQTNHVIDCIKKINPEFEFTIVTMETLGDRILDISLPKIGEKALFTKDLEDCLRNNSVDFVVHSLKDLPTALPDGLAIGAVFEREDPRDALVLREDLKGYSLDTLPEGSIIGTSSLRRRAQVSRVAPSLHVESVRGNLNTRLRKLDEPAPPPYSALILAAAGLARMGCEHRISKTLSPSEMLYAVGQGALGVEVVAGDRRTRRLLAPHNHPDTYCRVLAERSFLNQLGGGCSAPVGVWTELSVAGAGRELAITGAVWSLDGAQKLDHTLRHTFTHITKPHKHKLEPEVVDGTSDSKPAKIKLDEQLNPIQVLNDNITNKTGNLNCEDLRECDNAPADERLFCGLTVNTSVPMDVIIKCESLGRELADVLIGKGALDVMKVTQDYIRSSIEKKT